MSTLLSRRALILAAAVAVASAARPASAATDRVMTVHRDPSCGCCEAWADHVGKAGFAVTIVDEADMAAVKARLRVPGALESCHTAEVGGYVIEGHVPARAILRLLDEKPAAAGLAVPGMPLGSPGMETDAAPETYDVVLFGPAGVRRFGRYRGGEPV